MRQPGCTGSRWTWLIVVALASSAAGQSAPRTIGEMPRQPPPGVRESSGPLLMPAPAPPPGRVIGDRAVKIDLSTAFRLAGIQNPELLVARQRVVEAELLRQFAALQLLPSLNAGGDYDTHTGNLQQSSGNILSTNRSSVYVGAGSNAVAAGTVSIPGVFLAGNVAQGVFLYLQARQVVQEREFTTVATRNDVLLQVALAYNDLIRAEAKRAIIDRIVTDAQEVARITAEYARTGLGNDADANRAATVLARRKAELRQREGEILTSSARLARAVYLDPSTRLEPSDTYAVPLPIVPEPIPLAELVAMALLRRPEMGARRASVRAALLALEGSRALPFSPTVLVGFSAGGFGGGSNLVSPVFGNFGPRADFDVVSFWTLQNLGVGNLSLINQAKARLKASQFEEMIVLDRVRDEVAEAHARVHARFEQITEEEAAVRSSMRGFRLDLERIKQGVPGQGRIPRPIEVLDSLKLLRESQEEYVDAILDYNAAQFELYVALGQPPACALSHPVLAGAARSAAPRAAAASTAAPPPPPPPPAVSTPFVRPEAG